MTTNTLIMLATIINIAVSAFLYDLNRVRLHRISRKLFGISINTRRRKSIGIGYEYKTVFYKESEFQSEFDKLLAARYKPANPPTLFFQQNTVYVTQQFKRKKSLSNELITNKDE